MVSVYLLAIPIFAINKNCGMKIHIIGLNDEELCLLAVNLESRGYEVTGSDTDFTPLPSNLLLKAGLFPEDLGWRPERIDHHLNAVIRSSTITDDNPELHQAQALGLSIYSPAEFIYHITQNKTRVLITGSPDTQFPTRLLLHVIEYWEKEVDYFLKQDYNEASDKLHLTDANDFVIFEADLNSKSISNEPPPALHLQPNIVLLCGGKEPPERKKQPEIKEQPGKKELTEGNELTGSKQAPGEKQLPEQGTAQESEWINPLQEFLKTVVPGGSITYNANHDLLSQTVANFQAPVRKFPYHPPNISPSETGKRIETQEGWVPVSAIEDNHLQHIEGVRWICQQLGVDASAFYEALAAF
jgi:UDP-N-acetylmuramate: L-alanyl-gamma-D-glutamyl-meso-diaminopimelate ligase